MHQFVLATITEAQRQTFELPGLPEGWLRFAGLLLIAALCYGVFWMYRREARVGASMRLRLVMAALRCAVIVLLVGVWLAPSIATEAVRTVSARVPVLIDISASMDVPDAVARADGDEAPLTRDARVGALLTNNDFRWLRELARNNELGLYAFGEQAVSFPPPWQAAREPASASKPATDLAEPPPMPPPASAVLQQLLAGTELPAGVANRTDAGQAIAAALSDSGSSPTAGIVLITDGAFNKGMSPEELAAYARRFKAPVYVVGVGLPAEPPNLRVVNISAPAGTTKDDPFEVRVEVSATGVERGPVQLELFTQRADEADESSPPQRVASRTLELGGDRTSATELFRIQPTQGGEFIYRATVERVPGEIIASDNSRDTTVAVMDQRTRVLLVAGRPSYDYRHVTTLLERDKTIDVSCWLQSADTEAVRDGHTVINELPRRPEDVFAYDVIILMDPNPTEFDSAWAITVRRLVDEFGGGLMLQAGPHYTSRFLRDSRLQDLVSIFPVAPDPESEVRLSEAGTYRNRALPLDIPDESRASPLLALGGDPDANTRIWRGLSGAWWYLPVQREKQLASVLLRGRDARGSPLLMAVQPFGSGRTAFLGFESTWRWRATGERYFNRFWIQTIRYLAQARRQGAARRGVLTVDRDAVGVGDYVKIEAQVLDPSFAPWHEPTVPATLEFAAGGPRDIVLQSIPGREGWFAGRALCDREGAAVIRVALPGDDASAGMRKHIRVYRPDIELNTLRMQSETLTRLAEDTGGRFVTLTDAGNLPALIGSGSEVRPPVRIGSTELWDRGWVLATLAGLLAIEWILRRRSQLL